MPGRGVSACARRRSGWTSVMRALDAARVDLEAERGDADGQPRERDGVHCLPGSKCRGLAARPRVPKRLLDSASVVGPDRTVTAAVGVRVRARELGVGETDDSGQVDWQWVKVTMAHGRQGSQGPMAAPPVRAGWGTRASSVSGEGVEGASSTPGRLQQYCTTGSTAPYLSPPR